MAYLPDNEHSSPLAAQLNRRQLLLGASAGAAGLMLPAPASAFLGSSAFQLAKYQRLIPELFQPVPRPPAYTPNLVIGSGFGGAISALRLAQAGQQVTVLERGHRWPKGPKRDIFSNDTFPDGRAFWHRRQAKMLIGVEKSFDSFGGVLDSTDYPNMNVWRGACVGGGSVVFTGVMIQPEQRYFEALFGHWVSYAEMNQTYYPRVRKMLRLDAMPTDIYNSIPFHHSRVWDAQVRKAGYTTTANDSIFNWDVIRQELRTQSWPSATMGLSNHGNSNGAKFDLNQNYLAQAQATGRTAIYPGHEVLSIAWDGSRYEVDVVKRAPDGRQLDRYRLNCDRLFLAAGSIGSSELLVKARAQGTLRNLNEHIGQGWGGNGDTIVTRSFSTISLATQGTPSASRIHDSNSGLPLTLENWYVPGLPLDLTTVIGSLGMAFDQSNRGHFSYNPTTDRVELNWPKNGNRDSVAAAKTVNDKIAAATRTVPGFPGIIAGVTGMNWTAHPLGGAVIGKATDAWGRVIGHPGLYVMDGALLPGSAGAVNPSLTISALAERNIEHIIKNGK
ncbi:GMC oxidoreductase [Chromobacterium sp. S0633]|uniref:GMC oxidoreductase n=1 Tax=Chromobacterium sp. S0633 TaxID=2957805 RepID=UPI00209D5EDA|nr:GMC oxidoreductase [Chromobacterium sp. S0633]MCP1291305.1 GMC oxidoreductase [Chromobacterium sp. S0633]